MMLRARGIGNGPAPCGEEPARPNDLGAKSPYTLPSGMFGAIPEDIRLPVSAPIFAVGSFYNPHCAAAVGVTGAVSAGCSFLREQHSLTALRNPIHHAGFIQ
jgi:hypothetical protein